MTIPRAAQRPIFPFTALVGQEMMKLALLLNAVNPRLGGVLIRGEKGTAKSTAVRALVHLLPPIHVVTGCPFQCDPDYPGALCDHCRSLPATHASLPATIRPAALVELPLGATDDRITGTIDLERAIAEGHRAFEPGLLARAHRGILYVDEVNLLQDHLVDVLLDAAAMGHNYVEREGISISHPAEFVLIGTMNPEEGELRPQLLDRFALTVEVRGITDLQQRTEIVRRRIAFDRDPLAFCHTWATAEEQLRQRISTARQYLPNVIFPDHFFNLISEICIAFDVDGLRADIALHRTATTLAAFHQRTTVTKDDIHQAAELVLPHRRRRQPFQQPELDQEKLDQLLDDFDNQERPSSNSHDDSDPPDSSSNISGPPSTTPAPHSAPPPSSTIAPTELRQPLQLPFLQYRSHSRALGRRQHLKHTDQGAHTSIPSTHLTAPLAIGTTLRAAAPYQIIRHRLQPGTSYLILKTSDIRRVKSDARGRTLIHFIVDASGSMAVRRRIALTKGVILALLLDAYRRRDRVSLTIFRDTHAELVLPPTNSVDLAEQRIRTLPTGGKTPLASALQSTAELLCRYAQRDSGSSQFVILLTDGRANVGSQSHHPFQEALVNAVYLRHTACQLATPLILVDCQQGSQRLPFVQQLSSALGASLLTLDQLVALPTFRSAVTILTPPSIH